jgi:GH43 family beta-xylosidase
MAGPFQVTGERIELAAPDLAWERQTMPIMEGPQVLVRGRNVFVVYSASASWTDAYCYGLLRATGPDVTNPATWLKSPEPVFRGTATVFGPGHGSFVPSPDGTESWMFYHSARHSGAGWDRVVNAQRYDWVDGAPLFGTPAAPSSPLPLPAGQLGL